jgi:uncharacterized protein YkwD
VKGFLIIIAMVVGIALMAKPVGVLASSEGEPTNDEKQFVALINKERKKRGLSQLVWDNDLMQVARRYSTAMRDGGFFGHISPQNESPQDRYLAYLSKVGREPVYHCIGENLFACNVKDVNFGHAQLMASPSHKDNIVYRRFDKVGVGIATDRTGYFWVTQLFLEGCQSTSRRDSSELPKDTE